MQRASSSNSFAGVVGMTEGIFGLIFASFLALGVIVLGVIAVLQWIFYDRNPPTAIVASAMVVAWAVISVFEWRSVALYGQSMDFAQHPLPVHIAMQQKVRGAPLRPMICAWWLAHAAAFVLSAHYLVEQYHFINPGPFERGLKVAVTVFVLISSAVAANTYLLLAIRSLSFSQSVVEAVWRMRIFFDLVVVLTALWMTR